MPEALAQFHFLRPWWLLVIVPALALAWLWARRRAAASHWESSIAPALLAVLLEGGGRPRSRWLPWLLMLTLCAAAIGLAGPTWQRLPQPVERKTDALVVVFDLSLSMFAEDVAPSRLVRARQKIADVLRRRKEGFTALVAYAGDAHAVVPLTDDSRTIENLLTALRPDMMPVLGSNLGAGLDQAAALFENAGIRHGRILVVTDGVDDARDVASHRDRRFPISFLGIGTERGGTIPLDFVSQPGQVLRSQHGDAIVAHLNPERLGQLATATYGRYHTMTLSDDDIDYLLNTPVPGQSDTSEVERTFDTWADMGFWAALLLIPFVLGGFRRGVLVLVPVLLLPRPADASLWDDLWQRHDQQAYQALRRGDAETAAALFDDDAWRAAALYRSKQYHAAADSYERQSKADAPRPAEVQPRTETLYNLGNALARQHRYRDAIAAYDEVLARDPHHEDARFNRKLLEDLERQRRQSRKERSDRQRGGGHSDQSSPSEGGDNDRAGQGNQDERSSAQSRKGQQAPSQQAQPGSESESQEQTASREERQHALEQWLRRVPDDPGGLLRRKFQYETNERLRRGEYRSQGTEKIW